MIIFRTLPIAASISVLVLAILGVVLTPIGWRVSEFVFISDALRDNDPLLAEMAENNRSPYSGVFRAADNNENSINILGTRISGPQRVFQRIVQPFYSIFGGSNSLQVFFYSLFGSLWSMLVWSFFGVGITRVCLLRLTRDERAGLDDALEYSIQKSLTAMLAVSLPMLAVFLLCIPTFLMGLVMGFDLGIVLVGIFWFVVLAMAIVMAVLLAGLLFGWPLIISSVACEGQNAFDAMTRAFAYTFQRPLNYFLYIVIAILFGGFCWVIASQVTEGVVNLGYWSTSWGTNAVSGNRIDLIEHGALVDVQANGTQPAGDGANPVEPGMTSIDVTGPERKSLQFGRNLIGFWNGFARTVCVAFIYGLFWCMASAIYLLLRKDVDETEMDEIYIVDERRTYELPPLKSDESGIPQVQPLAAESQANDSDDSDVG